MSTSVTVPSGRDFGPAFEANYDPAVGLRQGGMSDRLRDRLVREERGRLKNQRWPSFTVFNLHGFALSLNLGELGMLEVPAAEGDRPGRIELSQFRLSMRDLGDGNFTPVSVLPAELAQEIVRAYEETGGVFYQDGTGEADPAALAAARARLQLWYRREYQKAIDSWTRYRQHKFITERQRDAARALFRTGDIAELPEWVTITRAQSDRRACPQCGEDIKAAARLCRYCRSVVDPQAASADAAPEAM